MAFVNVPSFSNRQFAAVVEWAKQPKFGNSFDLVSDKDFSWPVTKELRTMVPQVDADKQQIVVGRQGDTDPLTMIGVNPGKVLAEFIMHLKQVRFQSIDKTACIWGSSFRYSESSDHGSSQLLSN